MEGERALFIEKNNLFAFFNRIKEAKKLKTWKEVYASLGISKTSFESYHSGRLTMPKTIFETIVRQLPPKEQSFFNKKIQIRPCNWGASVGGKTTSKRYPKEYAKRRSKGLEKIFKLRSSTINNFDLNMELSDELCEFIGAFIGDGYTSGKRNHYKTEFTGDLKLDKEYHKYISSISFSIFNGVKAHNKISGEKNFIRTIFYSKQLHTLLTERFQFPEGVKCYTVKIPKEIIKSDEKFMFKTIRGIFDTDGGGCS